MDALYENRKCNVKVTRMNFACYCNEETENNKDIIEIWNPKPITEDRGDTWDTMELPAEIVRTRNVARSNE